MFLLNFRDKQSYKLSLLIPAFLVSSWAIFLLVYRIFEFPNQQDRALATLFYFTTQSNILIWFVLLLGFTKFAHHKWVQYLAFIALIDILITGIVFHVFLASFLDQIELMQHVLHTVVPITYLLFYTLTIKQKLPIRKFYIALIHPLIFLISVYLFIEPIFGDILNVIYPDLESARYVYPFLDPVYYELKILGLIGFISLVLTPFICLISIASISFIQVYHKYLERKQFE